MFQRKILLLFFNILHLKSFVLLPNKQSHMFMSENPILGKQIVSFIYLCIDKRKRESRVGLRDFIEQKEETTTTEKTKQRNEFVSGLGSELCDHYRDCSLQLQPYAIIIIIIRISSHRFLDYQNEISSSTIWRKLFKFEQPQSRG